MKVLYVDTFTSRRPQTVFEELKVKGDILEIGERKEYSKAFSFRYISKIIRFIIKFLKTYEKYDVVIINNRLGRIFFQFIQ